MNSDDYEQGVYADIEQDSEDEPIGNMRSTCEAGPSSPLQLSDDEWPSLPTKHKQATMSRFFGNPLQISFERVSLPNGKTRKVVASTKIVEHARTTNEVKIAIMHCSHGCGKSFSHGPARRAHEKTCSGSAATVNRLIAESEDSSEPPPFEEPDDEPTANQSEAPAEELSCSSSRLHRTMLA